MSRSLNGVKTDFGGTNFRKIVYRSHLIPFFYRMVWTILYVLPFSGSKLTAGIHKLADTLTKTTKKKTADRQRATSSPVEIEEEDDYSAGKPTLERNDSFDEKVKYINRPSSKENLLDGDEERDKENQVTGVDNEAVTNEEELAADDYLQLVREPTEEEKQVELKVQQRIEAGRKGEQVRLVSKVTLTTLFFYIFFSNCI